MEVVDADAQRGLTALLKKLSMSWTDHGTPCDVPSPGASLDILLYDLQQPKTHQSAHRMPKETLASWITLRKKPHLQTTTMKMCSSTQSVPPHTPKGQVKNTEEETEQVLVVIKCIYLPPTYLHFIQDIEDRCLLITSFVDLPFQEHRMMEKHHMDQNPCISSLCPK
jgi:hypothetical protein